MSWPALKWALEGTHNAPPHLRLTLIQLAMAARGADGSGALITQAQISSRTGIGVRQIRSHLAELVTLGVIRPSVVKGRIQGYDVDLMRKCSSSSMRVPTSSLGPEMRVLTSSLKRKEKKVLRGGTVRLEVIDGGWGFVEEPDEPEENWDGWDRTESGF